MASRRRREFDVPTGLSTCDAIGKERECRRAMGPTKLSGQPAAFVAAAIFPSLRVSLSLSLSLSLSFSRGHGKNTLQTATSSRRDRNFQNPSAIYDCLTLCHRQTFFVSSTGNLFTEASYSNGMAEQKLENVQITFNTKFC